MSMRVVNSHDELEIKILENPNCSFWLKEAIVQSHQRDVLDAERDAELLLRVLKERRQHCIPAF